MNIRILVLKTDKHSTFLGPGSNLFYSVIEKRTRFKKRMYLRKGMFSVFLVEYDVRVTRIKLKRYWGCSLFKTF